MKRKKASRNEQIARVLNVIDILRSNKTGSTVLGLWATLRIRGYKASKRTIYRDIEALKEAGMKVKQRGERWKLTSLSLKG